MAKLRISRFTTKVLMGWCVLLFVVLLALGFSHLVEPHAITLHALTLNGFLASILMGLRVIVLFLVFSTIPMRWPITLLAFMTLTIGVVATYQFITVVLAGNFLVMFLYLIFVIAFLVLLYTAILMTSETIIHNDWEKGGSYLKHWGLALLNSIRQYSLPLLISLVISSLALTLTNSVTF
ncbi:hypothetical protein [Levilactobacillus acidifarinae]|uniref:Uncharacterized protein n=1 Tax=Levilactobacillus acidifarinae DSM 19394 = JCM 15949 TaxID=1423715 RepID=A0A0R1LMV7_9LACO|nr:hypothetical protein [Levilactobacillus acidifarinae]KRK94113.1 hypothetical protein FD25_GL001444 [Levilactobacillus acidifarinae DSM 19394]GEO69719.1 hypothetical protein LAC03_16290 [Levilactobacillus acidifarinae]